MADKKKQPGRGQTRSQTAGLKARTTGQEQPVKSIKETTRDERKEPPVKSIKEIARDERKEPKRQESKPVRRDTKEPLAMVTSFRNNRIGRFILDAYYELRHKVTWPTFEEARNMTVIVIALSAVIGAVLGLADFGLYRLFLLISGG